MNKKPETLLTSLHSEELQPSERAAMRERVQAYIAKQPVRRVPLVRQLWHGISFPALALNLSKPMIIALIVAVAVALGGGVSYAAEQSLPGDALYAVKTSVNEPVREVLALSAEAKSEWEARRLERRLEEAETLAAEGRLSEEIRVAIEQHLQKRIEDLKERIGKFQEKQDLSGAAEASARLEIALSAHDKILEKLTLQFNGPTKLLHEKVKKEHEESQDLDDEVQKEEDEDDDDKSEEYKKEVAEGKREAAKHKWEEVKEFVAKAKVSDTTRQEAEALLKAVEDKLAQADALLEAKKYEEAFEAYRNAHRAAQEVKAFVSAEQATEVRVEIKSDEDDEKADREDEERKDEEKDEDEDRDEADKKALEADLKLEEQQREAEKKEAELREEAEKLEQEEQKKEEDDKLESSALRVNVEVDSKDED